MKTICLILFISFVYEGLAIKCYNCQSSATNDCEDTASLSIVTCTPIRDAYPPVCIRRIVSSDSGKNITLQCVERQSGNECDPPTPMYKVEMCHMCQQSFCNGSDRNGVSLSLILFSLSLVVWYLMD